MKKFAQIEKTFKGIITPLDRQYFEEVEIREYDNKIIVCIETDYEDYYKKWLTKTNSIDLTNDPQNKIKMSILYSVGDPSIIIDDLLKTNQMLLLLISDLFENLTAASKKSLNKRSKNICEILNKKSNDIENSLLINIKDPSLEINNIIENQKAIKYIYKDL